MTRTIERIDRQLHSTQEHALKQADLMCRKLNHRHPEMDAQVESAELITSTTMWKDYDCGKLEKIETLEQESWVFTISYYE